MGKEEYNMSQAKVDKYKDYKKNRKEILEKQKRKRTVYKAIAWLVGVTVAGLLLFAVAYSGYGSYLDWKAKQPVYTRDGYIVPDMVGYHEDPTEASTEEDPTEEASTEGASEEETETNEVTTENSTSDDATDSTQEDTTVEDAAESTTLAE